MWHLNNNSQKLNLKYESPASHPWVTRLLRSGAIESPASRWKMRVPCEAKLSRDDRSLLYYGLAISNTCSHAKNRNDPIPITWSKVALHEDTFFAVAILGGVRRVTAVTCLRWPTVPMLANLFNWRLGVFADRDQLEFLCSCSDSRYLESPCGHSGRLVNWLSPTWG